jgi:hypothetical protein
MFRSVTRDQLKKMEGYYRPAYEEDFMNTMYRYNPKYNQHKIKGAAKMHENHESPVKKEERERCSKSCLSKLAEITLNLRENQAKVRSSSNMSKLKMSLKRSMF